MTTITASTNTAPANTAPTIPADAQFLASLSSDYSTRIEWGTQTDSIYATGKPLATFASFNDAVAAAQQVASAKEYGSMVVLKSGSSFAISDAIVARQTLISNNSIDPDFKPHVKHAGLSELKSYHVGGLDFVDKLDSSLAAVVDNNSFYVPVPHKFGGTIMKWNDFKDQRS